jgi:nucleoid-associated protein YgaU
MGGVMNNRVTIKWESSASSDLAEQTALVQLLIDKELITRAELVRKVKETASASVGLPDLANHTVTSRGHKTRLVLTRRPKTHRVKKRETLKGIAKKFYGSTDHWQRIAKENDIEDPRQLAPGTLLTIPRLDSDEDER